MKQSILDKLQILADAAKYDVSCASSGLDKRNTGNIGNSSAAGICHTWSYDGRCISLLKILMTNRCIYDCAYCISRASNDISRASFEPEEIAELTIEFYRRNYIEGLFLSSAIEVNPNHTMEKIIKTLHILRVDYQFTGYIHIKAIPGADPQLVKKAGELTDRMSVNIELPTKQSLKLLAPQKSINSLFSPMQQIKEGIKQYRYDSRHIKKVKSFVPAGQSTQMIIGATPDSDLSILHMTEKLYQRFKLKRVYFSAYVPVNKGTHLPALSTAPPLLREHRLYQADWLLRFYGFNADELLNFNQPNFDLDFDPKMMWALKNIEQFPMEINKVPYKELLRIPGIGVRSAQRIMKQRQVSMICYEDLKKMRIPLKRTRFFVTCNGRYYGEKSMEPNVIKKYLKPDPSYEQLTLYTIPQRATT